MFFYGRKCCNGVRWKQSVQNFEAHQMCIRDRAQSWEDQDEALVVRISQIESRLLGITGILDIANTTINEKAANHKLALDHIPVLGSLAPTTIEIKA